MNSKLKKAAQVASGIEPFARAARDSAGTVRRIAGLAAGAFRSPPKAPPTEFKFKVFTPWGGSYLDTETGETVFVRDRTEIPDFDKKPNATRGAWFGEDDFSEMMTWVFTDAQRAEMAAGASATRRLFILAGTISVSIFSAELALDHLPIALACLGPAILFFAKALAADVQCQTASDCVLYDLTGYFKKFGKTHFARIEA